MSISGARLLIGASRVDDDAGVAYFFCTQIRGGGPAAMYLQSGLPCAEGAHNQAANSELRDTPLFGGWGIPLLFENL